MPFCTSRHLQQALFQGHADLEVQCLCFLFVSWSPCVAEYSALLGMELQVRILLCFLLVLTEFRGLDKSGPVGSERGSSS